jgi:hypothetical protein
LQGEFLDVAIAKVDADSEKELGTRFGITGFPVLKIFKDGVFHEDYNDAREWKDIAAAMRVSCEFRSGQHEFMQIVNTVHCVPQSFSFTLLLRVIQPSGLNKSCSTNYWEHRIPPY